MGAMIGREDYRGYQVRYKRLLEEMDDQRADVANLIKLAARISVDVGSAGRFRFRTG